MSIAPRHHKTGFYYGYKHNPNGPTNNHAFFILGGGCHTEPDAPEREKFTQIYLPLFTDAHVYQLGKFCDVKPLEIALRLVEIEGKFVDRYTPVTDTTRLAVLKAIRNAMYPEIFE